MIYVVAVSVALTTGLVVFLLVSVLPGRSRAVRTRMAELGLDGGSVLDRDRYRRRENQDRVREILESLGHRMGTTGSAREALRARLVQAGYREPLAVPLFLGIRVAASLGLFVVAAGVATALEGPGPLVLLLGAWGWVFGWVLPGFVLSRRITLRKKELVRALPDALDLLVICVEAGLGLNQALLRVAAEMRHVSTTMTDEIVLTNLEIRAGTPREQALRSLAERTGVPDIHSLTSMLIQAERFGTSIARSLRVQSETLREKRKQRAEEAAAKTAVKLLFPLAFCIFPAMFVVVLGPAMINILRTLSDFG